MRWREEFIGAMSDGRATITDREVTPRNGVIFSAAFQALLGLLPAVFIGHAIVLLSAGRGSAPP